MTVAGPKQRRSKGMTLVEVVIALAVLAIAFFGMVSVVTYTSRMNASTRERMLAMRAAERKIEQMLSVNSFDDIFLQFSQQTEGLGWEQVTELDTRTGIAQPALRPVIRDVPPYDSILDVAQRTVETGCVYPVPNSTAVLFVRFPCPPGAPTLTLTEVKAGDFMGMATPNLDLDRSGTAGDAANLTISACTILPVSVDIFWKGVLGSQSGTGNNYLRYRYTFLRRT